MDQELIQKQINFLKAQMELQDVQYSRNKQRMQDQLAKLQAQLAQLQAVEQPQA